MKRFKRIYILLGVLAAACLATFGVMRYEEHKEQIEEREEIILQVAQDSVKSLSWEYESNTLSFRKEENWIYEDDEAFPVDEEKINGLLEPFEAFGVSFVIEKVEDYSQYGLDRPICTIRMETEELSCELLLGNYSELDQKRYVSIGDGNVYLVNEDPLERFAVRLSDLIEHDETPYFEDTTAVQFEGNENYSIFYEKDSAHTYRDDDVYFTERGGETKPLDPSLVDSYLETIENMSLTNYVTYNATKEELADYGLDEPELTVTVDYSSRNEEEEAHSDTFVLHVSRDPREDEAEEEITAYARVGESQIVYQISAEDYENLMAASYDDLRHQEILSADFADIKKMELSLEGNVYTLTSEEKEEQRIWYNQGEEVEISDLRTAIANLKAERFTEEPPEQKEEISLTVYLDDENETEIFIELYRYDGENCLAVVDQEPVALVKRSAAVDLIEAVYRIVLDSVQ